MPESSPRKCDHCGDPLQDYKTGTPACCQACYDWFKFQKWEASDA